jgi:hypothetical protein
MSTGPKMMPGQKPYTPADMLDHLALLGETLDLTEPLTAEELDELERWVISQEKLRGNPKV